MLFFLNLFIQKKFNRMIHDCLMNDKYLKLLFRCAKLMIFSPFEEVLYQRCGDLIVVNNYLCFVLVL